MKTLFLLIALLVSSQIYAECIAGVGDCQNGRGAYRYDNGNIYVGDFVNGAQTGKGTYTWAYNGNKYEGEWKDGKRHGRGVATFADGTTKSGVWENDIWVVSEAELRAEQTKRKLAEEKRKAKRAVEEKARKKYQKIYNACLLDKGKEVDMSVVAMRGAVQETCETIAEDPSWLEELKYD